jgi:signal transduction histidine kinase
MSQVEAGKIQLDIKSVDPVSISNNAISTVSTTAKEKRIGIQKKYADGNVKVKADAEKTSWVLNNFLINAIKYSGEGSEIVVVVKKENGSVQFSVIDKGPGIQEQYLPKVFDRFFKVPGSKKTGTGLGLAISKEFIEAQNGKIWVKSQIGEGCEFGFDLPVDEQASTNSA